MTRTPEHAPRFSHLTVLDIKGVLRWAIHNWPVVGGTALVLAGAGLGIQMLTGADRGPQTPPVEPNKASEKFKPPKGDEPSAGIVPPSQESKPTVEPTSTAEVKVKQPEPILTPEIEQQQAQCSFFKNPKFCGLAEVYEMFNPRVGNFKGVGIKGPFDSSAEVEVVAPFDGYLRHSPNNPGSGSISTDKNSLNGFSMEGNFEFIPITRADGMPVKKDQKIATIKDLGLTAIPQAPDYIARFLPQNTDESGKFSYPEQLIAEHFHTAHKLPSRALSPSSSRPPSHQREGAIVEGKNTN